MQKIFLKLIVCACFGTVVQSASASDQPKGQISPPAVKVEIPKQGGQLGINSGAAVMKGGVSTPSNEDYSQGKPLGPGSSTPGSAPTGPQYTGFITGAYFNNTKYASVDYYANEKIKLTIMGTGKCQVYIHVRAWDAKFDGGGANALGKLAGQGYGQTVMLNLPATWESDFTLPPYQFNNASGKSLLEGSATAKVNIGLSAVEPSKSTALCKVMPVGTTNASHFDTTPGHLNYGWYGLNTRCDHKGSHRCTSLENAF